MKSASPDSVRLPNLGTHRTTVHPVRPIRLRRTSNLSKALRASVAEYESHPTWKGFLHILVLLLLSKNKIH